MSCNTHNSKPLDDALAILAAIIAEKHLADTRNIEFNSDRTRISENGDMADESSDRQDQ